MSAALLDRYTGDAFMGQDRTDLHAAAFQGQLMTLYGLIRRGADVNKCTSDRVSPLHDACSRGYLYCAEMLVKHGADVSPIAETSSEMSLDLYEHLKVVGKGSYGEVWLVRNKKDKKQVSSISYMKRNICPAN
eukprot:XP_011681891.1 PREDICTED: ankyrin repeat and SOCS box protein 9-like [Strongylocentrotus purpuratus]